MASASLSGDAPRIESPPIEVEAPQELPATLATEPVRGWVIVRRDVTLARTIEGARTAPAAKRRDLIALPVVEDHGDVIEVRTGEREAEDLYSGASASAWDYELRAFVTRAQLVPVLRTTWKETNEDESAAVIRAGAPLQLVDHRIVPRSELLSAIAPRIEPEQVALSFEPTKDALPPDEGTAWACYRSKSAKLVVGPLSELRDLSFREKHPKPSEPTARGPMWGADLNWWGDSCFPKHGARYGKRRPLEARESGRWSLTLEKTNKGTLLLTLRGAYGAVRVPVKADELELAQGSGEGVGLGCIGSFGLCGKDHSKYRVAPSKAYWPDGTAAGRLTRELELYDPQEIGKRLCFRPLTFDTPLCHDKASAKLVP